MQKKEISNGIFHKVPDDLYKALASSKLALTAWEDISTLARNEWICWTISVKTEVTRKQHVERVVSELAGGKRRPCCWMGCVHRTDKPINSTQKYLLGKLAKKVTKNR